MGPVSAVANNDKTPGKKQPSAAPAEEKFWVHYSHHHELPLSSILSILAHGLAVGLVVVIGLYFVKSADKSKPLPLGTIEEPAGGGGNPEGQGDGPGNTQLASRKEVAPREDKPEAAPPKVERHEDLTVPPPSKIEVPPPAQADPSRVVNEADAVFADLDKRGEEMKKSIQAQIARGLREPGKGRGGPGSGGGLGSGKGTETGPGTGRGGDLSVREKRLTRWQLNIQTRGPQDFLSKLAGLGAVVAIPEGGETYRVFRDVSQPPYSGTRMNDLAELHRIGFTYDDAVNAAPVARLLRMPPVPFFIVFFPEALEQKMVKLEENLRGRREEEINERIVFDVVYRGGTYDVVISNTR
jgi:hypothetical protein